MTGDYSRMWPGVVMMHDNSLVIDGACLLRPQCCLQPVQLLTVIGGINVFFRFQNLQMNYAFDILPHSYNLLGMTFQIRLRWRRFQNATYNPSTLYVPAKKQTNQKQLLITRDNTCNGPVIFVPRKHGNTVRGASIPLSCNS